MVNFSTQVPRYGEALRISPSVMCVLAHNPSPMTGLGTNSYVIGLVGGDSIVVDPGPPLPLHHAVLESLGTPQAIVLSHSHFDHSECAPALAEKWNVPIYAMDSSYLRDTEPITDGLVIEHGGVCLRAIHTPGHTPDSVSFAVDDERVLLTGDTILGDGSTALLHPEGSLSDYLHTLELLETFEGWTLAPGHGSVGAEVSQEAYERAAHRLERLSQVREQTLLLGFTEQQLDPELLTEDEFERIFESTYPKLEGMRGRAARRTLRAQLLFLSRGR